MKRFRQRIIGYEERTYTRQPDGAYFYGVYPGTDPYPGYAIMGTGTAILHRAYLEMYFDSEMLPHEIFEYVNKNMNCEDLSMNVMVTKFLDDVSWQQPSALAVKPIGKVQNMEGEACKISSRNSISVIVEEKLVATLQSRYSTPTGHTLHARLLILKMIRITLYQE